VKSAVCVFEFEGGWDVKTACEGWRRLEKSQLSREGCNDERERAEKRGAGKK
jgi:hypothetical protein